jgi:hypothetical protein
MEPIDAVKIGDLEDERTSTFIEAALQSSVSRMGGGRNLVEGCEAAPLKENRQETQSFRTRSTLHTSAPTCTRTEIGSSHSPLYQPKPLKRTNPTLSCCPRSQHCSSSAEFGLSFAPKTDTETNTGCASERNGGDFARKGLISQTFPSSEAHEEKSVIVQARRASEA